MLLSLRGSLHLVILCSLRILLLVLRIRHSPLLIRLLVGLLSCDLSLKLRDLCRLVLAMLLCAMLRSHHLRTHPRSLLILLLAQPARLLWRTHLRLRLRRRIPSLILLRQPKVGLLRRAVALRLAWGTIHHCWALTALR